MGSVCVRLWGNGHNNRVEQCTASVNENRKRHGTEEGRLQVVTTTRVNKRSMNITKQWGNNRDNARRRTTNHQCVRKANRAGNRQPAVKGVRYAVNAGNQER